MDIRQILEDTTNIAVIGLSKNELNVKSVEVLKGDSNELIYLFHLELYLRNMQELDKAHHFLSNSF